MIDFNKLFYLEKSHSDTVNFPLINQPIWIVLSFLLIYFLIGTKFGPNLMKNRKAVDIQPYLLILNGFNFGVFTLIMIIIFSLVNSKEITWDYYNGFSHYFIKFIFSRIVYTYFCILCLKLVYPFLFLLKKTDKKSLQLYSLKTCVEICIVYYTIRYHFEGPFAIRAFLDIIDNSFKFMYFTLSSAGKASKPPLWFKRCVILINLSVNYLTIFEFLTSKIEYPTYVKLLILTWSLLEMVHTLLLVKKSFNSNSCKNKICY